MDLYKDIVFEVLLVLLSKILNLLIFKFINQPILIKMIFNNTDNDLAYIL